MAPAWSVAMEVVRLLKKLGVQPRRTIRIALWSGEEQGLFGSRGYVKEHFGSRPESTDPRDQILPAWMRPPGGPLQLKPEQKLISAYFNLDNGPGKDSRRLSSGERPGAAHLREVDGTVPRPGDDHADHAQYRFDGPCLF